MAASESKFQSELLVFSSLQSPEQQNKKAYSRDVGSRKPRRAARQTDVNLKKPRNRDVFSIRRSVVEIESLIRMLQSLRSDLFGKNSSPKFTVLFTDQLPVGL